MTTSVADRLRLAHYAREVSAELRKAESRVTFIAAHLAATQAALDAARDEVARIRDRLDRPDAKKARSIRLPDGADDMTKPFALKRPMIR